MGTDRLPFFNDGDFHIVIAHGEQLTLEVEGTGQRGRASTDKENVYGEFFALSGHSGSDLGGLGTSYTWIHEFPLYRVLLAKWRLPA